MFVPALRLLDACASGAAADAARSIMMMTITTITTRFRGASG